MVSGHDGPVSLEGQRYWEHMLGQRRTRGQRPGLNRHSKRIKCWFGMVLKGLPFNIMTFKEWTELAGSGVPEAGEREGKLKAPGFYRKFLPQEFPLPLGFSWINPKASRALSPRTLLHLLPSFTCSSVLSRFVPDGESSSLAFPISAFSDFTIGSMKLTVAYVSKCYKSGTPPTQELLNIYQHLPAPG